MKAASPNGPDIGYPVQGDDIVAKGFPRFVPDDDVRGHILISPGSPGFAGQRFEGVPIRAWETTVGGYPVIDTWLKQRRGRKLSFGDLQHVRHMVAVLDATCEAVAVIDDVVLGELTATS